MILYNISSNSSDSSDSSDSIDITNSTEEEEQIFMTTFWELKITQKLKLLQTKTSNKTKNNSLFSFIFYKTQIKQNGKTQIATILINSNCETTQKKKKIWTLNSDKTQKSNSNKTQKLKFWPNLISEKLKQPFSKNNLTIDNWWDVLWAAFPNIAIFFKRDQQWIWL